MTTPARTVDTRPEDLSGLFFSRLNAGDVEGALALFESTAVSRFPDGRVFEGREAVRTGLEELAELDVTFPLVEDEPALVTGDLALTSRRLPNGDVPVEVARRQSDGSWLWVLDNANVLS
ncbi:nuclear transport factor 2 family protein [Spiractinospora alimapuensis]|uniref:YybH family protein n=1 Tax=Spiractinospora alimapuensis TaxID=2820884 RepID=UPI001F280ACE|nr:nuclear transport factor 2 family protein [Spiractinospora alimapuensis]QVQ52324.1 nuclear transport factor 2 family protein [Spiractinospora alimapuensis]